jgi:SPX domain protein involved in polyphosphate accumulation
LKIIHNEKKRDDLGMRREVKYLFWNADPGKLRNFLEVNCRRIVYHKAVSTVRSIYFDTYNLAACRANLNGIGRREKVRLRWYDSIEPISFFFFEIKWRKNLMTGKKRLKIGIMESFFDLPFHETFQQLESILPDAYANLLIRYPDPVIIVEYKREHFISLDQKFRLTLDYDLVYYDQFGKIKPDVHFARRTPEQVILECKGKQVNGKAFRELIFPFSPRVSRCSKYVTGCQFTGLID